ncbi:MAG: hypothetical protein DRO90_03135, partial [Candidatus Altiarchaeales archaeon]
MRRSLYSISIDREELRRFRKFFVVRNDLENFVTFEAGRRRPIYNWFYYKEAFSPELIFTLLDEFGITNANIIDPFCGVGTTLLASVERNCNAVGFDILPLSVFVSNVKLQRDYDMKLLREKIKEITSLKFGETELKWPDIKFISIKKSISRYARNDLLFFKERIMEIEDEKIRNFIFLGLLSISFRATNLVRDGGVLKIDKSKRRNQIPVRHLLRNKLKRMYKDVKNNLNKFNENVNAYAKVGDARSLGIKSEFDLCITSPPYLNWVDYTKIYAIELALLGLSYQEILELRKRSLRSHVGAEYKIRKRIKSEKLESILENLNKFDVKSPEVLRGYFEDLYLSLRSIYN